MTLLASRHAASRLARVAAASSSKRRTTLPAAASAASAPSSFAARRGRFQSGESHAAPTQDDDIVDSRGLLQFQTLHEMNSRAAVAFRDNELFGTYRPPPVVEQGGACPDAKKEERGGRFEWMTYGEYGGLVARCRTVLNDIGIGAHDKIGIISNNRWEWAALASAAYSLNAAIVPMYETQLPKDWTYILNDAGCSALFCSTDDIFVRALKETLPNAPAVRDAFCFDGPSGEPHALSTALERAEGTDTPVVAPGPDDLAGLIYTSGTTGKPKGVELTHDNFVSNVYAVRTMADDPTDFIRASDRSLAFLPWAHSYGQTCELWCTVSHGGSMGVCRGVPQILDDLAMVKPTVLFAVPTLYKKVYDGVQNMIGNSSPTKQKLMRAALDMGRKKKEGGGTLGLMDGIRHKVLDALVTSKIRARFGGNLRHGFVAGAACPKEIIDFMDNIGIPICEGYGLTETSPIIAINAPYPGLRKTGRVGKPVGGVNVVIMDPETNQEAAPGTEGEICCYGRNVMRGYYGNAEATAEVISTAPDGKSRLFHTGDLGTLDEDGFVAVTGRLKEQYKLENGKYVVPTPIEEAIAMSRFIAQVVVCGANRPHNVALIVPDWVAIRASLNIDDEVEEEDLFNNKEVRGLIDEEIRVSSYKLKRYEVPQNWAFVAPFTAANNMLTPKMSIRRKIVIKSYEEVIGHMYGDSLSSSAYDGGHKTENIAA